MLLPVTVSQSCCCTSTANALCSHSCTCWSHASFWVGWLDLGPSNGSVRCRCNLTNVMSCVVIATAKYQMIDSTIPFELRLFPHIQALYYGSDGSPAKLELACNSKLLLRDAFHHDVSTTVCLWIVVLRLQIIKGSTAPVGQRPFHHIQALYYGLDRRLAKLEPLRNSKLLTRTNDRACTCQPPWVR